MLNIYLEMDPLPAKLYWNYHISHKGLFEFKTDKSSYSQQKLSDFNTYTDGHYPGLGWVGSNCDLDSREIGHSISNRFFQCFSYIIDRVHQNSPSMHFRRANTDSGGPIRIQEG